MASKSPLTLVKENFGDKAKLVETVEKFTSDDLWVARTNKDKGLAHVSNAKLLRLHALFSEVKDKFGTREKLIDAILELEKRTKDAGFRQHLSAWPVPRLYDTYKSLSKRARVAAEPAVKRRAPRAAQGGADEKAAPAKAPAKKAAAKSGAAGNASKGGAAAKKSKSGKKGA